MRYADGEETEEKPKSRGSGKPSAKFLEFWKEVYDGGKKEVPNPRKKEKGKPWKPQVAASTAMLNRTFKIKIKKEFQAWLKQQKDDKKPKEEPKEEPKEPKRPAKVYEALEKKIRPESWARLKEHPFFKDDPHKLFDLCGLGGMSDENADIFDGADIELWASTPGSYEPVVELNIQSYSKLRLGRTIHLDGSGKPDYIKNDIFFIKDRKGLPPGLGAEMLSSQAKSASKAGFKHMKCHAAWGGDFVGYYVWPILGYDSKFSVGYDSPQGSRLRKFAEDNKVEVPETIQELYAIPGGRAWWKENGWDLDPSYFDLSEGSKSLEILRAYMEGKKTRGGSKKASKKPSKKMPKGWRDAPHIELDEKELDKIFQTKANKTKKKASLTSMLLKVASDSPRIRRLLIAELRNSMRN